MAATVPVHANLDSQGKSRQVTLFANPVKASLLVPASGSFSKLVLLTDAVTNNGSIVLSDENREAPGHIMLGGQCTKKEDQWMEFRIQLKLLYPLKKANFLVEIQHRTDKNNWESSKQVTGNIFHVTGDFEFLALRVRHSSIQLNDENNSTGVQITQDKYKLNLDIHFVSLVYEPVEPLSQRLLGINEPIDFTKKNGENSLELDVDEKILYALPECLIVQSAYFKAKISDNRDAKIRLPNKRYEDILLFLNLIYPGSKHRLSPEQACHQLAIADEFGVPNLKETAERVLEAAMRAGKISPVKGFLLARRHKSTRMEDCSIPLFAKYSIIDIEKDPAFAELPDGDKSLLLLKKVRLMEEK